MPDILIRGMEMPRNCFECPLFTNCDACEGHECGCGLLGGIGYEEDISEDRRRDDCPLVELPEHGDLVDVNTAYDKIAEQETSYYMDMDGVDAGLQVTPVVVPAERRDADA